MRRKNSGFTLVEMLVVIGIIVVLVALLVPMAGLAVGRTRNFDMTAEISQLAQAVEMYKKEKGDYPPSMKEIDASGNSLYLPATRFTTVCEKHLRKCYPKMTNAEKDFFYDNIAARLTGDRALVFWLSMTTNDERNPFTSLAGAVVDPSTGVYEQLGNKKYYDFEQDRLQDFDPTLAVAWTDANNNQRRIRFPSYKPNYAGETAFVYLDSRTYAMHRQSQFALGPGKVQAYFNDNPGSTATQKHYVNDTTFQIICAGQDREFGDAKDQFDGANVIQQPKRFKSGENYTDEDNDNLANFSEGRRLEDHIP
jgi:prepilin-type N-terminal cleavage/methylation domain-containing protein